MKQAPKWLPYRVRQALDQARVLHALRGLSGTSPYPAADLSEADVDVHMLLCHRDARLGVLALKSLLRFGDGKIAVTFTDDGTLTQTDLQFVRAHIPGARWLDWPAGESRLDDMLQTRPRLTKLYNSRYAPVCKLLHATVLAGCDRVLVLDPDTAFFRRPETLLNWSRSNDAQGWYLHDHQDESTAVPVEAQEAFEDLERALVEEGGRHWTMSHRFFNSGLLAFRARGLDLDLAEGYLEWRQTAPDRFKAGKLAIWFGDWTPEQTCYHVMFALAQPPARPLGDDYHLGGDLNHVFNHFLRHYLVRDTTLGELRGLISQL